MVTKTNAFLFQGYTFEQERTVKMIREVLRSDRAIQTKRKDYLFG